MTDDGQHDAKALDKAAVSAVPRPAGPTTRQEGSAVEQDTPGRGRQAATGLSHHPAM